MNYGWVGMRSDAVFGTKIKSPTPLLDAVLLFKEHIHSEPFIGSGHSV